MKMISKQSLFVFAIETVLFILFCIFGEYKKTYKQDKYGMFQDVHVMIFVGFGFLMTFLKRYGYSAVGFNFLLGSLIVQWAILCQGFFELNDDYRIEIGIESLYKADIAAAAVLISMGAVLGRTSYIQLLVMGIMEVVFYAVNAFLCLRIFKIADAGGSIYVHCFGAHYGLAVSYILDRKTKIPEQEISLESSRYTSDLFSMIGTIFLWLFWPSFNAIDLQGDEQHRAVINTYLALASCCVVTFAASAVLTEEHKFDMVHIQNATLAGGVAVGATANLMLEPYGAILIGIVAGLLSTYGYSKISPFLTRSFALRDTCGVHNLHGMPSVAAGLLSTLMAGIATEAKYGAGLYDVYPARASPVLAENLEYGLVNPKDGRNASEQAGYQIIALLVTMVVAIVSGLVSGFILKLPKIVQIAPEDFYDDVISWTIPQASSPSKRCSVTTGNYDNPAFDRSSMGGDHVV